MCCPERGAWPRHGSLLPRLLLWASSARSLVRHKHCIPCCWRRGHAPAMHTRRRCAVLWLGGVRRLHCGQLACGLMSRCCTAALLHTSVARVCRPQHPSTGWWNCGAASAAATRERRRHRPKGRCTAPPNALAACTLHSRCVCQPPSVPCKRPQRGGGPERTLSPAPPAASSQQCRGRACPQPCRPCRCCLETAGAWPRSCRCPAPRRPPGWCP